MAKQISPRRVALVTLLAAGPTFAPGCDSGTKPSSTGGTSGTQSPVAVPAGGLLDPVATTQLRERSLALLSDAVASSAAEERANALEALTLVPSRLAPVLPRGLADANPGVRSIACKVVGRARQAAFTGPVLPLVSDPIPFVKGAAIYALAKNGISVDQSPLAQMLFSPEPSIRAEGAFLIGELGNRSALPMVKEAYVRGQSRSDPALTKKVQLQIAEAIVKLGDDSGLQELRAALYPAQEKDYENAALAAQILGQLGDKASIDQLIYITASLESGRQKLPAEVRLAAASALARLGNDRGSFLADEYAGNALAPLRAQAALVYGETGRRENLPKLSALLTDREPLVRIAAAAGILKITER